MESGEKRHHDNSWFRKALVTWMIIFSIIAIYAIYGNRQAIDSIQASRIHSCQQTYGKLTEIVKLSVGKKHLEPVQRTKVDTILAAVDPKQCIKQVKVKASAFPIPFKFVQDALAGN